MIQAASAKLICLSGLWKYFMQYLKCLMKITVILVVLFMENKASPNICLFFFLFLAYVKLCLVRFVKVYCIEYWNHILFLYVWGCFSRASALQIECSGVLAEVLSYRKLGPCEKPGGAGKSVPDHSRTDASGSFTPKGCPWAVECQKTTSLAVILGLESCSCPPTHSSWYWSVGSSRSSMKTGPSHPGLDWISDILPSGFLAENSEKGRKIVSPHFGFQVLIA